MKIKYILPIIIILLVVGFITYSYRWIFSYHYKTEYMNKLYLSSQYVWPRGPNIIDDSIYYQIVGYKIVSGDNPFYINVEQPPFAKSIYGISEHLTGNPYWAGYLFFLLSLLSVYYLSSLVLIKKSTSLLSTLIFILNPLTIYQLPQIMLDLPLTLFMVIHIIFLFKSNFYKKNLKYVVFSGILLGIMSGTKIAYFTLGILFIDLIYYIYTKRLKNYPILLISALFGYIASWFIYFIRHPNPIPWIRLHQNIYNFYKGGWSEKDYLNVLQTIFLNRYHQWSTSPPRIIPMVEWSILLPLGTLVCIYILINFRKYIRENLNLVYLSALGILIIIMNSIIPFWPRYLIIVIPAFSIVLSYFLNKKRILYILFLIIYIPFIFNVINLK